MGTVVLAERRGILGVHSHGILGFCGDISIGAIPGGPTAALRAKPRDAVVTEEELGFEFVEIGHFKPPAGDATEQGTQNGFLRFRGCGKDDITE